ERRRLDVEDDEEHGDEVKLYRETPVNRRCGIAAFVRLILVRFGFFGTEVSGEQRDDDRHSEADGGVDEKRKVDFDHSGWPPKLVRACVFEVIISQGLWICKVNTSTKSHRARSPSERLDVGMPHSSSRLENISRSPNLSASTRRSFHLSQTPRSALHAIHG